MWNLGFIYLDKHPLVTYQIWTLIKFRNLYRKKNGRCLSKQYVTGLQWHFSEKRCQTIWVEFRIQIRIHMGHTVDNWDKYTCIWHQQEIAQFYQKFKTNTTKNIIGQCGPKKSSFPKLYVASTCSTGDPCKLAHCRTVGKEFTPIMSWQQSVIMQVEIKWPFHHSGW